GLAGGYSQTSVHSGSADGFVKSSYAAVYAGGDIGHGYVEGTAHWADQDYETNRHALSGANAQSDHDGQAYGARLAAGVDLDTHVTAFNQLAYDHIDEDAYTETGAPGFNQRINPAETDSL